MRYQERIYIQNEYKGLRNRDVNIFGMSTDMCIFESPKFSVSGASKITCSAATSGYSYIISATTQPIPLEFIFTANTNSFTGNNATFKYKIYKFDDKTTSFPSIPLYSSENFSYSAISVTTSIFQNISPLKLKLDGDYLIKGFYNFPVCTEYLNKLNKAVDTQDFISGSEYGIYNKNEDFYFVAVNKAAKPYFAYDSSNSVASGALNQTVRPMSYEITYPDYEIPIEVGDLPTHEYLDPYIVTLPAFYTGSVLITLNGLVLANGLDYTISGSVATLNEAMKPDDVVTVIYYSSDNNGLITDVINIVLPIVSGVTNNQGNNLSYFNTTTNKYEVYTSVTPADFNSVLVMLNGVTLANGLDFYQSITDGRRIILQGEITIDDVITIAYLPSTSVVADIRTSTPSAIWLVTPAPDKENGFFTLQVSYDNMFTNMYYTGTTQYAVGGSYYTLDFPVSGLTVGTSLYYRVKNDKNYETICGNIVNSYSYSDIIPITISTNSINSY